MGRVGLTAGAAKDEALRWVGLWLVVSACLPGLATHCQNGLGRGGACHTGPQRRGAGLVSGAAPGGGVAGWHLLRCFSIPRGPRFGLGTGAGSQPADRGVRVRSATLLELSVWALVILSIFLDLAPYGVVGWMNNA